jgi:hypothetical protein
MATSPNFSWPEPDNSDLVKNGALAIRTAVDAIDASMAELKGGTTGQVLAKASNTDMDFVWSVDAGGISPTIFAAKGDLLTATGNDTPAVLTIGANGTFLTPDSSQATGLKYATAAQQFPWAAYTFTPSGVTVGNGTLTARYQEIGKTVNIEVDLLFGSTTSITGIIIFGLPVTAKLGGYTGAGVVTYGDAAVGNFAGTAGLLSTTSFYLGATQTSGAYAFEVATSSTIPFTWTTNDRMTVRMTYEAA